MSLKEYERKRNFSKTSEPRPEVKAAREGGGFFVQRHDASHLHYDFRLAIEGVLKSWAVPKGPSMDPAVKRLAMEVEDHPLAYGAFEGNIPKGEYGGGSVMLWDTGTFSNEGSGSVAEQWRTGRLKIRLEGEKLRGTFGLIRMKGKATGKEWLLVKDADEYALRGWDAAGYEYSVTTQRTQAQIAAGVAVRSQPVMSGIKPMLAVLAKTLPEGPDWIYEVKWDGVRTLLTIENGLVSFESRNGLSYNSRFPELKELPAALALSSGVVDGEIVAADSSGRISFQALQPRLGIARFGKQREGPHGISIYLFDLLFKDGKDLRKLPLRKRRAILIESLRPNERVKLSQTLDGSAGAVMEVAAEHELEGIMAKRLDSPYAGGRSAAWVKVKLQQRQEFVVCGWIDGNRASFGALVLGLFESGRLHWRGNVGTGFSEQLLRDIGSSLKKSSLPRKPAEAAGEWPSKMHWARPTMVAEIRFAEFTQSAHLRAPVFLGLRPDRRPEDCMREIPVSKEIASARNRGAGNRKVTLSHQEKIYFPAEGLTKGDLLAYYESVAPVLLPHLKDRPASLRRYPDGIHGKSFFQKNLPAATPDWVPSLTLHSEESKRDIRYALVQDLDVLLYVVNLGCIDHNPWMSRKQSLDSPNYVLFDLDPFHCDFDTVIAAAHHLHEVMDHLKMEVFVKTSGSNGLHIAAPLKSGYGYEEVKEFTAAMAATVMQTRPDLFTIARSLSARTRGRVYFDYVQIGKGKTIAAPYSVRPRDGAPVSTPLQWTELKKGLRPSDFHMRNTVERIKRVGDLWAPVLKSRQALPKRVRAV